MGIALFIMVNMRKILLQVTNKTIILSIVDLENGHIWKVRVACQETNVRAPGLQWYFVSLPTDRTRKMYTVVGNSMVEQHRLDPLSTRDPTRPTRDPRGFSLSVRRTEHRTSTCRPYLAPITGSQWMQLNITSTPLLTNISLESLFSLDTG